MFSASVREQIKVSLWNDHFAGMAGRCACSAQKIRKLVAMGIPESLRGRLWLLFSGEGFWGLRPSFYFWSRPRTGLTRVGVGSVCVRVCARMRRLLSACDMPSRTLGPSCVWTLGQTATASGAVGSPVSVRSGRIASPSAVIL